MEFSANHWVIYLGAGIIVLFAIAQSIFFLVRAMKRARAIGIKEETLKKTIASSAIFTIAPAVAILIGVFTLMYSLGTPLPWVRLSIIGALTYELTAASAALEGLGRTMSESYLTLTGSQFVTVLVVMTVGIMIGLFLAIFFVKPYKRGLVKLEQKDKKWSDTLMSALFMGMISAFLGLVFKDVGNKAYIEQMGTALAGWIPVFVMLVSAVIMLICAFCLKKFKWKWLNDYAIPVSMVLSMALAIPITNGILG